MISIDLFKEPFCELPIEELPPTVLALGNFDGVHIGHVSLLKECVLRASELSKAGHSVYPGVWIFRDPPSDFIHTPKIPHLSSFEDKLRLFRSHGIRYAIVGDFRSLSSHSPEEFAALLRKNAHCIHAVCGFNYTFGHRGAGSPSELMRYLNGAVSVMPPVEYNGSSVSSTRIRALIQSGDVEEASALLGRPYALSSPVLYGKALGRTLSFPTANQKFPKSAVVPKSGIYAVTVRFPWESEDSLRYGVANVGLRPTVEHSDELNCETFVFDFSGDLYGKTVEIGFSKRLRDERKMSGLEELRETIARDAAAARQFFGI